MKSLADLFPGCIIVFATLKEAKDLSDEEITRIRKLANWGRRYDKERKQSRAPVIMLTGTELFTEHDLGITWEDKGGRHKDLIRDWLITGNLRILADLTQQLYLDMPPYIEWLREKWKKRGRQ